MENVRGQTDNLGRIQSVIFNIGEYGSDCIAKAVTPVAKLLLFAGLNANQITLSRLVIFAPIIIGASFLKTDYRYQIIMVFAIAGFLTDAIDGIMARLDNNETDLGMILDPIADKILIVVILFQALEINIAVFWTILLLQCTAAIFGGLIVYYWKVPPFNIKANFYGKIKMFCYTVGLLLYCFVKAFSFSNMGQWIFVKFYLIVNNSLGCLMNNLGSLTNHSIVI